MVVESLCSWSSSTANCAHGAGGDVEDQGGDVGVEELVEGASDAVVVECGELALGKPEQGWIIPRGPLADAVEWCPCDEQVACQQEQCRGVGDAVAAVLARQPATQRFVEAQRAEEAVEEGQCPDFARVEGVPAGLGQRGGAGHGIGVRGAVVLGMVHGTCSWRGCVRPGRRQDESPSRVPRTWLSEWTRCQVVERCRTRKGRADCERRTDELILNLIVVKNSLEIRCV